MTTGRAKVLVLCLGNPDRGDDGIGMAIAEALAGRLPEGIAIMARSGDMLTMIEEWAGFDALVCVDAAASLGEPGRIHRIDLRTEELPRDMAFISSHAFGVGEAIALARTLGLAPKDIIVYGIEGENFAGGAPMSARVIGAVAPAVEQVAAEATALQECASHA